MRKENGITLIALIITIIVMLILVGVTVNVALSGGIFEKAKIAKEDTQRQTDKEQLLAAVVATLDNDGKVFFGEEGGTTGLDNNLPKDFEGSNGTYINRITGKEYTVNAQTGNVEEKNNLAVSYSFKLVDLPTQGMVISGNGPKFNLNSVKQVLGEDLFSENSKYLIRQGAYGAIITETDNDELIDLAAVNFNLTSTNANVKHYFNFAINFTDNEFQINIIDKDNYSVIEENPTEENELTWSQFVSLYPDTVFTILDVSNLSI